ncbi:peptidase S24 [Sphingomonas echinoides]|uniref:peptidase S24 n=1 Tax=Sphingomonas echinoides TaxID=59803 RepID=UPI002413AE72|nr:peptidase S24 [Sphingomonas echinoides]
MKPIAAATPDRVRETLRSLATEHRVTLATLSRMLRRPPGYVARFARGAGPDQLPTNEVPLLAQFFRVDPRLFGKRED